MNKFKGLTRCYSHLSPVYYFLQVHFPGTEIIDRDLNSKGWEAWESTTFALWIPANHQDTPLLLEKYVHKKQLEERNVFFWLRFYRQCILLI